MKINLDKIIAMVPMKENYKKLPIFIKTISVLCGIAMAGIGAVYLKDKMKYLDPHASNPVKALNDNCHIKINYYKCFNDSPFDDEYLTCKILSPQVSFKITCDDGWSNVKAVEDQIMHNSGYGIGYISPIAGFRSNEKQASAEHATQILDGVLKTKELYGTSITLDNKSFNKTIEKLENNKFLTAAQLKKYYELFEIKSGEI